MAINNGKVGLAVMQFHKVSKLTEKLERENFKLNEIVQHLSQDEVDEYFKQTN